MLKTLLKGFMAQRKLHVCLGFASWMEEGGNDPVGMVRRVTLSCSVLFVHFYCAMFQKALELLLPEM